MFSKFILTTTILTSISMLSMSSSLSSNSSVAPYFKNMTKDLVKDEKAEPI